MSYLVKHYMRKEVPTINERTSVIDAAKTMMKSGRGFLVVLKEAQPAGIVTEHDFVDKVIVGQKDPTKVSVGEIMSSPLITIDPDENLLKASELMHKHNIRRLPVVRDGIIYGAITSKDIVRSLGEYVDQSIRDLIRWATPFGL